MIVIFLVLILAGCGVGRSDNTAADPSSGNVLTVSAAISLKDAFTQIGALYKTKTGNVVAFNFGASGTLQRQIESGAPADVFASAGERQMDALAAVGVIDTNTRRDFAGNSLVLIVPTDSELDIAGFNDLSMPDVRKIAVGNPKTVPAGQYAARLFEMLGMRDAVHPKLIVAENVRQVFDYVMRGEVDAGIVYATDAAAGRVRTAAVAPDNISGPILYPIAMVKNTAQGRAAKDFIDLVSSPEGQTVLHKYGFSKPAAE